MPSALPLPTEEFRSVFGASTSEPLSSTHSSHGSHRITTVLLGSWAESNEDYILLDAVVQCRTSQFRAAPRRQGVLVSCSTFNHRLDKCLEKTDKYSCPKIFLNPGEERMTKHVSAHVSGTLQGVREEGEPVGLTDGNRRTSLSLRRHLNSTP